MAESLFVRSMRRAPHALRTAWDHAGTLLLGHSCVLCELPIARISALALNTRRLCVACTRTISSNVNCCDACGVPLPIATERCGRCLRKRLLLTQIIAPFCYQAPLDQLLIRFKKTSNLSCGRAITDLWLSHLRERKPTLPDALIAVPMHVNRLRERGFNQALLLARAASAAFEVPLESCLQRMRDTPSQGGLRRRQRQHNVRGAFALSAANRVRGQHIVLIDDVATTASTLNACALPLLRAGAKRVDAWVVARA
jgi:ComF family protein